MKGKVVLFIDDEQWIRVLVNRIFTEEGAQVITAGNALEGLHLFHEIQPDLVILDILMPGLDGWEACRQIRQHSHVPCIVLTVLNTPQDVIRGLEMGVDDFVSKPFHQGELLARAKAVLRRVTLQNNISNNCHYDDGYLAINLDTEHITVAGMSVKLTATECAMLMCLVKNTGLVCTFNQILNIVWQEEGERGADSVHTYIWQLRQKLEPDPKRPVYLVSEYGIGYRFEGLSSPNVSS